VIDALWWIAVITLGVALGVVVGDWLRRGGPLTPSAYYGILIAFLIGYGALLYFMWRNSWASRAVLWLRDAVG